MDCYKSILYVQFKIKEYALFARKEADTEVLCEMLLKKGADTKVNVLLFVQGRIFTKVLCFTA